MNKHNLSGSECFTGDKYINPDYCTTGGVGGSDVCFIQFISFHFSCY